jgi:chaperonin GroES
LCFAKSKRMTTEIKHPTTLTMIESRVLVFPDAAPEFLDQAGTLIIPDTAKEAPPQGTAIAIGADVKVVKEGDKVLYSKHAGIRTEFNKQEYLILHERDIHCVL